MTANINPRYLAYARVHGELDPDVMLARDRKEWPGGVMCGYIIWLSERWSEYHTRCSLKSCRSFHDHYFSPADHDNFDAWLAEWTPA